MKTTTTEFKAPTKHPLASNTWGPEEIASVQAVVGTGHTTMGPHVANFEQAFANYIGTKYAVMVNSGSSANLLMVAAYTLRYGKGEVIVPAVSWATSFSPFQQYGWHLVFVDIDDSLNIDPDQVRLALRKHPDAMVLAVNLLGNPCDFNALARQVHVNRILEDNCESLGAVYGGVKTGALGLMGTHSFFFSHHMSTMEGGMITTNDRTFYEMLLSLRSHGWTRHLPVDNVLGAKVGPFEFIFPGYNVRATDLQGAAGMVQLGKLDAMVAQRRLNAQACPLPLPREIGQSSWFALATPKTEKLEALCETRPVVAGNFTRSPALRWYTHTIVGDLPMANKIHDEWCYIGNHHWAIDWSAFA